MDRKFETILESSFKRCGFGEWIHWFCVDERLINVEKKYIICGSKNICINVGLKIVIFG